MQPRSTDQILAEMRPYLQHKDSCGAWLILSRFDKMIDPGRKCTCGLDQLTAALDGSSEPSLALRSLLHAFVSRERALIENRGKGGQHTGQSPSITPSVLRELEWMLRNSGADGPSEQPAKEKK